MLMSYKLGQGSIILRVKILDSAATTGAGKTGLTSASSGLIISTIANNEATATAYTVAAGNVETITTLGTYEAPTSGKCRFKEVDATNHKGVFEIHIADARFAVSSAKSLLISISGASGAAECDALIPLVQLDPYEAMRGTDGANTTAPDNTQGASVITALGNGTVVLHSDYDAAKDAASQTSLNDVPTNAEFEARTLAATSYATAANQTTLLDRLTASRAGYLDNLNVGGAVASNADILALNQSASRRILLTTVGQYERPESGSTVYTIEARTFDGDGAATNADSNPTLTGTGQMTGSLAANIGTISNPATGVYRWEYTVASGATIEPVRFDISATMTSAFTLSVYTQVVDFVSATWTSGDASKLTSLFDDWANGGRLDNILDARASQTSVDDLPTNSELTTALASADDAVLAAISALNNLSQSQVTGGAYALSTDANGRVRIVDGTGVGELDTLSGTVLLRSATQTSIDAIEADTNELQGDWVNGGRLDLLIDAIKAKTDQMTYSVANKLDSNPTPTSAICNRIADHVRRRTQANVEASSDGDTLDLSSLYGFIQQAQESLISETTLTVNRTDGTTALGTKTLTSSASAEPVTGIA